MQYISWTNAGAFVNDICALWNKEIGGDFPMRQELFRTNSIQDRNIVKDGSWIVLDNNNSAAGFIVTKLWQEDLGDLRLGDGIGWIQVLMVDSDYAGQGIGTKLLTMAEQKLTEKGAKTIILGSDPWHYFPGVPEHYHDARHWFEQRGYKLKSPDPEIDLYSYKEYQTKSRLPELDGVTFRTLQADDRKAILQFLHDSFPGRWEYEAIKYFEYGGTGREFVVAEKDGKMVGFCRINDSRSPFIAQNVYWAPLYAGELGGIGPLGINQASRGYGCGLAIVQAAVNFLQNRGIQHMVIDWTGLESFYEKLGFKKVMGYARYQKTRLS